MPRLVQKEAHGPKKVGDKYICMCGLSKNQPFCDSSHLNTLDEDEKKLYWYGEDGKQEIVTEEECGDECCGSCGDGCCQEDKKTK